MDGADGQSSGFILASSADPDEMLHFADFIWVFTVYQSTHLGVSRIQRVKQGAYLIDPDKEILLV